MPPFGLFMANIENRRKMRIIIPILIGVGALITIGAIIAAVLIANNKNRNKEPDPTASATETYHVTETPAVTSDPTSEPSNTPLPEYTEAAPVRVSDENSQLMILIRAASGVGEENYLSAKLTGSCALIFVNNTDLPLYSANLFVSGLSVISATVNGSPARFTVSEDGVLTIPFLEELFQNESISIFFEFQAELLPGDEFTIPCFGEDMACEMQAFIETDTPIVFTGITPSSSEEDGIYRYTIDGNTVRSVTAHFHF